MQKRWIIAPPEELNGGAISWRDFSPSDCIARLLMRKGFSTPEEVETFLRPRLRSLSDPFLLPNMEAAVVRVLTALDRKEPIILFGDYDVDGVTSVALLAETLRTYGADPALFLPLRMEEGYGLSRESIERCLEQHHPQLLIAVDCGTSSANEIVDLGKRGVDVIVLDHHEPPLCSGFTGRPPQGDGSPKTGFAAANFAGERQSALPNCVAIVNPKIDPESPFHYLCSVGIVFKLCHALLKTRPVDFDLKSKLDLVALGTVADIVPLRGENRTLVQRGFIEIARSTKPGLRKLIETSGVRPPILPEDIGFRLGPRLNAAGRLSNAERSLRLLLTHDEAEAASLAALLDQQNRERQEVEKQIFLAADEQIGSQFDPAREAAIVLHARGWHAGVLGIVASRISRKYHRPTILIGFEENGTGKGSGRSIQGLNLVEALSRCRSSLQKFGGHEMAAGLTINEKDIDLFAGAFRQVARELLSDEDLQPCLRLDHELTFPELGGDFLSWHEMLQPFGNGNPAPVFFAREVEPVGPPRLVNEKHLILRLRQRNNQRRAVYFDGAREKLPRTPWDVAFRVCADEYEGATMLSMQIQT
ncbi:MAG: single-stranded-DNA-specific exonuclease RecJ, partial [Chthoniobacterales bacterium]